ncbi:DNA translocase FtsK [Collinsella intestinalis]|nr:DNA translocase FtsK [Collinsella intestinalis]VWM24215.1 DNA translocase FtsK [Collinsella intestinalis]
MATQRPSSNVVTGLIKANITNRIAFNVATGIDSRVIIDQMGAEKLTGYGDMLFSKVDWGKPKRIQGCFVSDDEINGVVDFVKEQGAPDYHEEILSAVAPATMSGGGGGGFYNEAPTEEDPLLWDAAKIVVESQLGSTSGLQRRLKVGYARAGRIMDMLEEKGIVGPPDGSKPREVLYDEEGLAALRAVEEPLSEEEIFGGM